MEIQTCPYCEQDFPLEIRKIDDYRCSDCKILDSFMMTTIRRIEGMEKMTNYMIDSINKNTMVCMELIKKINTLREAIEKTGIAGAIEIVESEV